MRRVAAAAVVGVIGGVALAVATLPERAPAPAAPPPEPVVRPLPGPPAGDPRSPAFAPKGAHLAYVQQTATGSTVYVAPLSDPTRLGAGERVHVLDADATDDPRWHPHGYLLLEARVRGRHVLRLVSPGADAIEPPGIPNPQHDGDVAPDGRSLAYVTDATGHGDLRTWRRISDTDVPLTATPEVESTPAFAADGSVWFVRRTAGDDDLVRTDGAEHPLPAPGHQIRPAAAGSTVVAFSQRDASWDLVAVEGDALRPIATDVALPVRAAPAVSPDGAWVAWTRDGPEVFLTRVDDGTTVTFASGHERCREPALGLREGRVLLAYTHLGERRRVLDLTDVTDLLR